jgi:amino acid transporter
MKQKKDHLPRTISAIGLSANIINIVVGAGIFALPALISEKMGASGVIAYITCGLLIGLIMLCFAEIGSKITNTGGAYTYIETAFGSYFGFLGGIFTIVANMAADAAVANVLVNILGTALPIFENGVVRLVFLFSLFSCLAFINVRGAKQGIGVVKFFVIIKLLPLLVLIIFGWNAVSFDNLTFDTFPSFNILGETSLILFFAFVGAEAALIVGGEVVKPKKNIPKAIFMGITTVLVIYIFLQVVSQGVLGANLPNFKAAPLAETARMVFGPIGFTALIIVSAISMLGYLTGSSLSSPRAIYAMSRDEVLPFAILSKIHKKYQTPYISILTYIGIGFVLAAFGSFEQLAIITTGAILLIYLGVVLSVIKIRLVQTTKPGEFLIPGGLTVPIASILIILYFLSHLTQKEIIGTVLFIAVLTLLFMLNKALKKS